MILQVEVPNGQNPGASSKGPGATFDNTWASHEQMPTCPLWCIIPSSVKVVKVVRDSMFYFCWNVDFCDRRDEVRVPAENNQWQEKPAKEELRDEDKKGAIERDKGRGDNPWIIVQTKTSPPSSSSSSSSLSSPSSLSSSSSSYSLMMTTILMWTNLGSIVEVENHLYQHPGIASNTKFFNAFIGCQACQGQMQWKGLITERCRL